MLCAVRRHEERNEGHSQEKCENGSNDDEDERCLCVVRTVRIFLVESPNNQHDQIDEWDGRHQKDDQPTAHGHDRRRLLGLLFLLVDEVTHKNTLLYIGIRLYTTIMPESCISCQFCGV